MDERKVSTGSLSMANELGKASDLWARKLRTHFCRLDVNCDGMLSMQDIKEVCCRFKEHANLDEERTERLKRIVCDWWSLVSQGKESLSCEEYMLSYLPFIKNSFLRLDAEVRLGTQHREMFHIIDNDRNGTISIEEYELFMRCIGITNKSYIKVAFDSIDSDGDQKISEEEFVKAANNFFLNETTELNKDMFGPLMTSFPIDAHRLSDLWFRKLTTLFCRMDPQEENVLSKFTMGSIASRFMSADMDDDQRRRISDVFLQWWSSFSHGEHEIEIGDKMYLEIAGARLKDPVVKDSLKEEDRALFSELFKVLDDDNDGRITLEDYVIFLQNLGSSNHENAEIAFYALDAQGNGAIDKEQFVTAAVEFLYNEEDSRSKFFVGPLIEL